MINEPAPCNLPPMPNPTARAMATSLRTYHRPIKEGSAQLETWPQVVDRVINHQRWLWERSLARPLNDAENAELEELRAYVQGRYIAPAGRTLFLGGTELSRKRESCMFNCSFTEVETVYDFSRCAVAIASGLWRRF